MPSRFHYLTGCLFFLLASNNSAALSIKQTAHQFITTITQNEKAHIGLILENKQTNKILFTHHGNQYFIPASIQKLFTASAATLLLKPNFHFKTTLGYTGKIANSKLKGNLYIQFTGDPTLTSTQLNYLLKTLSKHNIKSITGKIFLDKKAFNTVPYPPGIIWDNLSYGFSSPTSAIILDENQFLLHFIPHKNLMRPTLKADLPRQAASFTNLVTTVNSSNKDCPITIYSNSENHYTVGGCLNRKRGDQLRTLAIRNIGRVSILDITHDLRQQKINFNSDIQYQPLPKNAIILKSHYSKSLKNIIDKMLKESDNLISNVLLKTIGAHYYHQTGNWQNGLKALAQILQPITKINFKETRITDGAGLSRYNLIQPRQVLLLLNAIQKNPILKTTILPALPIAGVDGTLSHRLSILKKLRRLHAKTGTMTGVSNLAGFLHTRHHGDLIFTIMVNGFIRHPRGIEKKMDRFLKKIAYQQ